MNKSNRFKEKRVGTIPDPATNPGPKPGDFELGSLQSRAAVRTLLDGRSKRKSTIRVSFIEPGSMREVSHLDIEIEDLG